MNLSRVAEDFIIWSSDEFGFVEGDDSHYTGSSMMPNKKNPDPLELIRGHAGAAYGNLISLVFREDGYYRGSFNDLGAGPDHKD